MLIQFDPTKVIQASAVLLKTSASHRMTRLRLLKLLYIVDRESLQKAGRPVTGDGPVAMRNGPVLRRTYDLIEGSDSSALEWLRYFRKVDKWEVELIAEPGVGQLSRYEIQNLQQVAHRFEDLDDWEVAEYTHGFPEWLKNQPDGDGEQEIPLDDLLEAVGLSVHKPDLLAAAAAESAFDRMIAAAARL